MNQKNSVSFLCFVFLSAVSVHAQICLDSTGSFRPNNTYDTNRRLILTSLSSNVTAQNGFYNASFGQDSGRVYAMGMCNPGPEPELCSTCIEAESAKLLQRCSNQTEGFSWQSDNKTICLVRYSNRSFFGSMDSDPYFVFFSTEEMKTNLTAFYRIWDIVMARLIDKAASSSNDDASLSNRKYYAADIVSSTAFRNPIYALMECTPDISSMDCMECLQKCVSNYESCCRVNQGGAVVRPSCFFRWDGSAFGGAFDNITYAPRPSLRRASPPPSVPQAAPPSLTPSSTDQANTTEKGAKSTTISKGTIAAIVAPTLVILLVLLGLGFVCYMRKFFQQIDHHHDDVITTRHSPKFNFKTIEDATDKFSESNLIGRGGFGDVYKGILPNGTQIAVKRLSKTSSQGIREFKNEAVLVAKLQHRNLVRLLGYCVEGQERILVYEFIPNKSLDYFLFDPTKQGELDWTRRYNIIGRIAQGLLYLHQDSRLTIIHRDLKASNILMDADMNPKISDFGMARILRVDQSRANTSRIVGTYGYMSPEYAMHGRFSQKSDVYSFGVMVLEIISGKVNSSFYEREDTPSNLVTHVWRLWRNGSPSELVDPAMTENYQSDLVIRCIHIALLCVQEDPEDRPTMSKIVLMLLNNTISLPMPRQPGFFLQSRQDRDAEDEESGQTMERSIPGSIDDASITYLVAR